MDIPDAQPRDVWRWRGEYMRQEEDSRGARQRHDDEELIQAVACVRLQGVLSVAAAETRRGVIHGRRPESLRELEGLRRWGTVSTALPSLA